ncbi:MAG TPA: hypothetical protein P5079_04525 [Elusimicrobiota bacterium]|nr:hypothetical protein [Elusimicrobiota bacterium]
MLTEDDLIDIIADALARRLGPAEWRDGRSVSPSRQGKWGFHVQKPFNRPWTALPMKRPFITEYMARQMAGPGREIRIPRSAILSPLAEDWLMAHGVAVVRAEQ